MGYTFLFWQGEGVQKMITPATYSRIHASTVEEELEEMGVGSLQGIPEDFSRTEGSCARPCAYAFPLHSPLCHNLTLHEYDENQTSAPTSTLNPAKWIGQLVAAVILAEGIWGLLVFSPAIY